MTCRFQFSIRLMLVVTAAVAAALAAVCAERSFQSAFAINGLTVAFTTAAIVAVIQTRARMQSFWAGTVVVLVPTSILACWSSVWLWMCIEAGSDLLQSSHTQYRFLWLFWCVAPINGLFAVVLNWLFAPRPARPQKIH